MPIIATEPSRLLWPLGFLTAAVLPGRWMARRYLPRRLALWGFDFTVLPPACLNELADDTYKTVRLMAGWRHPRRGWFLWRADLGDSLDATASLIIYVLDSRARHDPTSEELCGWVREILARHGVFFVEP